MSYLQDAIKNSNTVAQQFYPRFVRDYNEQFPFTEPNTSSIENPISNTSIRGYLKPKTVEQVVSDLKTKFTSLTNDENVTNYIGQALARQLSLPVLSYYNDNFNSIQKKIPISRDGISKDMFVEKVLSVLRSDPYFNTNTSIYNDTPLIAPPPPQQQLNLPIIKNISNNNQRYQIPILRKSILPTKAQVNNDDSSVNAYPVMNQLYNNNINNDKTNFTELNPIASKPEIKRGRPLGIPNRNNRNPNITHDELKELFERKHKKNADDNALDFSLFKSQYLSTPKTYPSTNSKPVTTRRIKIKTTGKGIQLEPLRIQQRIIKHKQVFNNNKYAIDIKKLKKNILDLKYVKNANHVATFQPIEISNNLKYIIDNIIKDHYNLETETFDDLNTTEIRILKRLFKFLNIHNAPLETNSKNDGNSIQQNFEIAYGSFLAGNNNKELIKELTQYVKLALHENTISKKDGYEILTRLNNK
jgi:hypothetical protein